MTTSKTDTYRVNSLKKKSYGASERLAFTYTVLLIPYGAPFWESLIKAQTRLLKKKKKATTTIEKPETDLRYRKKRRTEKENDRERTSVCVDGGKKNLRRNSGFATIRPPYPPPVWSLSFCIEG